MSPSVRLLSCILVWVFLSMSIGYGQIPEKWTTTHVDNSNEKAELLLFSNPDSAFRLTNETLIAAQELKYESGIARSNFLMGLIFYHQGVFLESLEYLLQAETFYRKQGNSPRLAETLNQQGLVYYNSKQPDLALEKHDQALSIYESLEDKLGVAASLGNIGRQYEKRGSYELSLDYNRKALGLYSELRDTTGIATILENIGSIYEDLEDFPFAMEYFRKSLELNKVMQDSLFMIININNIGDIFRKTNQFDSALHYSFQALELSERLNEKYQLSSAYRDLGKIYADMGEMGKAYEYLETGRRIYDEMYSQETSKQLGILQTLFEAERKSNDILLLQQAKKADKVLNTSLVIGFMLLLVLGYIAFNRQKIKMQQSKQLHEAEKKIMQSEIENKALHEQQLEQEITAKSKSLTAHTLHIIGKNRILEEIRLKLKGTLENEPSKMKKSIRNLIKMIDFNFTEDKDWEDFKQIFEQIHQNFFDQLNRKASDLTPADIRLAALIRINLPPKDMATILGISSDSLRTSRYRLKKKLKLDSEASLTNFILSI